MDKEILVKEVLSKERIAIGNALLNKLDEQNGSDKGLNIQVALWVFSIEREKWKLILVPKDYGSKNLVEMYLTVLACLNSLEVDENDLALHDVVLTSPDDQFVRAITDYFETTQIKLQSRRLKTTVLNGAYIEDGYLYRVQVD
jgi:hypothetical protein